MSSIFFHFFLFHYRRFRFSNNCYMLLVCSYHSVSTSRLRLIQGNNSWNSKETFFKELKINFPISLQNIRRNVVSWILVVVVIVMIQLMVLFDVIHVVNTKNSEASDKSFMYTALEVFCLGEFLIYYFIQHTRCKCDNRNFSYFITLAPHYTQVLLQMLSTYCTLKCRVSHLVSIKVITTFTFQKMFIQLFNFWQT